MCVCVDVCLCVVSMCVCQSANVCVEAKFLRASLQGWSNYDRVSERFPCLEPPNVSIVLMDTTVKLINF